jgi:hypothetical protein
MEVVDLEFVCLIWKITYVLATYNINLILDVIVRHIIWWVWEVLPFRMLSLEGQDGQTWKDHVCNCALCHLSQVDGQIDCVFDNCSHQIMLYVVWAIYVGCHYVHL